MSIILKKGAEDREMDFEYIALSLAHLSGLPVRLYEGGSFVKLYHSGRFKPDLAIFEEGRILENPQNVSFYMTENFLTYGLFRARTEDICLLIGPTTQVQVTRAFTREILRTIGEPAGRADELLNYLRAIPSYPLQNFLQILCTFDYFFNGEKISVGELLMDDLDADPPTLPQTAVQEDAPAILHNTYELEQQLLACVEQGNIEAIQQLILAPPVGRAGALAADVLRQQKNLFTCSTTLVTRAAIRGGIDHETAFSLSDLYIQKAELLAQPSAVTALMARMALDFTQRVAACKCGEDNHRIIRSARNYIMQHIDESITIEQLAKALATERTSLCRTFKTHAGISVNHFITRTKLDEAKRLMLVTAKSVAEISELLGFSSQSYFQNVFKRYEGVTPREYRAAKA